MHGEHRIHLSLLTVLIVVSAALLGLPISAAAATATRVCATAPAGQAQCDLRVVRKAYAPAQRRDANAAVALTAPALGAPAYLQQAYDLTALSASRGHADTVAIVDVDSDPGAAADLATYRAHYGLPACSSANGCLKIVNQSGRPSPLPGADRAWAVETSADLDAVSAICPNCHIDLVEADSATSPDLSAAMASAARLGADQISDSWSIVAPRSPFGASLTQLLGGAGAPTVVAATGDSGEVPSGENAYPAALPDVTAVGGTTLTPSASARGVTESAWSGAGYGCDSAESKLAYQPTSSCGGRAYADVSADADPTTGLSIYEAAAGGWAMAGGTSVATPIVAAYEALTAVGHTGNRWAYADAGALNAITGGYAGQTGTGTISGDVVSGAPGISPASATDVSATSVTLNGGVYANGAGTSDAWQYGTTTGYGTASPSATLTPAAGASQVSTVISGLAPATTYHFRLSAVNANGTAYGYDAVFTTSAS